LGRAEEGVEVGEDGGEAEVGLDAGAALVAEGLALFDREGEDF
jgi:hypothetical protein